MNGNTTKPLKRFEILGERFRKENDMKSIRLIDATHLDKRIYNDIPLSVFGSIKKMAAVREIVEEEPTVEAVPLSWWNELKATITELRDNNAEDKECDAYTIGRFLCNMIDIIEKRGK